MKNLILILLLVFGLSSSTIYARPVLTEAGCSKIAHAVGFIQHYVREGSGLDDLMPDRSALPKELEEHLKLLEMMSVSNPKMDPQDHAEEIGRAHV